MSPRRDPAAGADILNSRARPEAPRPGAATARRTKPVRITTDLEPPLHKRFKTWVDGAQEELDVAKLAGADVVRSLIHRLLEDPKLSKEVLEDLRGSRP